MREHTHTPTQAHTTAESLLFSFCLLLSLLQRLSGVFGNVGIVVVDGDGPAAGPYR